MISYVWNAKEEDIYKEDICNVIKSFLIKFKKESMDVEIQFDSDDVIKMLNNSYRDIDHSTDVLSFPNFSPEELKTIKSGMLGSIIIAYPTAKKQAKDEFDKATKQVGAISIDLSKKIVSKVLSEIFTDEEKTAVLSKAIDKIESAGYEKTTN